MPRLSALIFDLDGTLVDSAADLRASLNAVLAAHGRTPVSVAEVKAMVGDGMRVLLRRAFKATGGPLSDAAEPHVMTDFLRAYQTQRASPDMLYPHAAETLRFFRAHHIGIGLCTNKLYGPTLNVLSDAGIADLVDFVAGSDTFPVFKPHPGHVLGVAAHLHVKPENCVMIGDSLNDIRAARGAKVAAIAVTHGYGAQAAFAEADAVIGGFPELPDAVELLGFAFRG